MIFQVNADAASSDGIYIEAVTHMTGRVQNIYTSRRIVADC
jgi:hypothetical protein